MKKVLVFGTGQYYQNKKETLKQEYEILGFIDNFKKIENFENLEVIKAEELDTKFPNWEAVVIMSNSFVPIARQLLQIGIPHEKIIFGQNIAPLNHFEKQLFGKAGKLFIEQNTDGENDFCYTRYESGEGGLQEASDIAANNLFFYFKSAHELENLKSIFCDKEYCVHVCNQKKSIVLDVGMNIGAASIYFANQENVKMVYAFEPFQATYQTARKNIEKNSMLSHKIESYNYGLGNKEEELEILYNEDMSCGMSTDRIHNDISIKQYINWVGMDVTKSYKTQVVIKNVSDVLLPLLTNDNIILKLDCEGSEYDILTELSNKKLLSKIDIIIMEWHDNGEEAINKILSGNQFTFFSFRSEDDKGMIYAFQLKNKI